MVPEDLLFWIAPISGSPGDDQNVLCLRHADAMSVPRGWTLDDRREDTPRLFMPGRFDSAEAQAPSRSRSRRPVSTEPADRAEQLVIDGTGEIERPEVVATPTPWEPNFDHDDDLDGLLEVSSPLLSRAFRGSERRSS